jgi:hypothetical protein
MRGQHLRRPLGPDHTAMTDYRTDLEASTRGNIGPAWAIAFVVCALLALVSPFL